MAERAREWPLVAFTIALQCASGMAIAAVLLDGKAALSRPFALAIGPVTVVGLLLSLFHVGRPQFAWRAVRNVARSRLSREIAFAVVFASAALLYSWNMVPSIGLIAAVLGLGVVLSSARIYLIPSQPVWNSGWLPLSFISTAALLGGLAAWLAGERGVPTVVMTTIGALALLLSAAWMVLHLVRLRQKFDNIELPALLTRRQHMCLSAFALLAGFVPMALVFRGGGPAWVAPSALLAAILGATLGRTMVYSLLDRLPRF